MQPRFFAAAAVLSIVLGAIGSVVATLRSANDQASSGTLAFRRMADGKEWTTTNLNVNVQPSYCYDDAEPNCSRYGRLYSWATAQRGCRSLGNDWRLPSDDEWRQMAKYYGGVLEDSNDSGKATFTALFIGGSAGFNAVFGGSRMPDGQYDRLTAHGLYWTASETGPATAWLYNFGKGGQALSRHRGGQKQIGASVRCVRE
jgi:uncharacterized protein (TIGR02145 family)